MGKTKKTKKTMTITRERALKLFEYFKYKTAGKWSSKRMEGKLANLPEIVDAVKVKNDNVKSILKEIAGASSIEVVSGGKKKSEPKTEPVKKEKKETKKTTKKKSAKKSDKKEKSRFGKKKQTKITKQKTEKTPGIIMSVLEFIQNDGPISAKKILAKLVKRFPNRNAESMERSIPKVPGYLKSTKGIDKIRKNDKGNYYIKK